MLKPFSRARPTTIQDDRSFEYPEDRFITVGLSGRMVVVVWTPTDDQ